MTTPASDLTAPSPLARVVALGAIQTITTNLAELDPVLHEALSDASLQQAAILLRNLEAAHQQLATLTDMATRRLTVLTGANGVFLIGDGLVVERTGGRTSSKRKAWDRPRLLPLVAKKAAALAVAGAGDDFMAVDLTAVAEQAAISALGCVPSDWRLPGLRALGIDPERFSDEAAPSATKFVIRPADAEEEETA